MTLRWLNVGLFGGLAVWMAVDRRWLAIGFALMALGQACLAVFWLGSRRPWILVESFGLLTVVGIATLVAGGVGAPTTVRYWLVLAASLVVLAPVGLLARRLGRVRLQR